MRSWFFLFVGICLATFSPTVGFEIFSTIFQVLKNIFNFKFGGLKFVGDYFKYHRNEFPDSTPSNGQEYDFIVVGAGSAGATLASRLSEVENVSVLLIEAGGHEDLIMDIPLFALLLQLNSPIDWRYLTEPSDNYCRGIENQQCKVAKGKVMGGTSTLNFMIATRGNKHDYDEWGNMTCDPGWSYDGMLKYFKKLEKFNVTKAKVEAKYHNFDGPVRITTPPYNTRLAEAFVKAGEEMGLPPVDYNGRKQTGFSYIQTNQINGERLSSNRAYLHPIRKRKNLFLSMNSHVTKVLIDPTIKTANGVEFTKYGKKIKVKAKKEVIISAGAIATPQLLMLSGIGPKKHLLNFNINVLKDAPVGENLMDHIAYGGLIFLVNKTAGIVVPEIFNPVDSTISDYLTKRTGKMATAGGVEGLGYVNVDDPSAENEKPNIELLFASVTFLADDFIHVPFGITQSYWEKFFESKLYHHAYLIWPLLMKPKSRGKILLRSSDPFDKPRLYANYFSDPEDVRVAVKGIRMAIKVGETQAMKKYGSRLHDVTVPGCERYIPDSDEYWECALKTFTITLWHHSGTCKMGKKDDPSAVVNTKLQVKGIKRLRVVDASIMPNLVTAHINIPTIAIAEKGADIIKSDWGFIDTK